MKTSDDSNWVNELNTVEVKEMQIQYDPYNMKYFIGLRFQTPAKERTVRIKLDEYHVRIIASMIKRIVN